MMVKRLSEQRGTTHHGWLHSKHTFSFGQYRNPQEVGFSDLLVINDDRVASGQGFGTHHHKDMEIFSYMLEGQQELKNYMGNSSVIRAGDVQAMSAGTGVRHSEFNPSPDEPVHLLQVWIVPDRKGVVPRYQQRHFSEQEKRGRLRLILSPDGEPEALAVWQEVRVHAGLFDGDEAACLDLEPNRYAYVHMAKGTATVNGEVLHEGDGARVRDERHLEIGHGQQAELLVFDLRPHELPGQ